MRRRSLRPRPTRSLRVPVRRLYREEHRGLIVRIETPGGQLEEVALPPHVEEIRRQTLAERTRHLIRESEDGTPAPSAEDIRNRILFEQTRPRPRGPADSNLPGWKDSGRLARNQTHETGRGMGFSTRTVDERVRPCCPFPHRTRPPERIPCRPRTPGAHGRLSRGVPPCKRRSRQRSST